MFLVRLPTLDNEVVSFACHAELISNFKEPTQSFGILAWIWSHDKIDRSQISSGSLLCSLDDLVYAACSSQTTLSMAERFLHFAVVGGCDGFGKSDIRTDTVRSVVGGDGSSTGQQEFHNSISCTPLNRRHGHS